MATQHFYMSLTPTSTNGAFIYTKPMQISYLSNSELATKQKQIENSFWEVNHNPDNYNASWSGAYMDSESANGDRLTEINGLQSAGKLVLTPDWP